MHGLNKFIFLNTTTLEPLQNEKQNSTRFPFRIAKDQVSYDLWGESSPVLPTEIRLLILATEEFN